MNEVMDYLFGPIGILYVLLLLKRIRLHFIYNGVSISYDDGHERQS